MIKVEKCYELREKINIEKANEKRYMEVLRNVFMITERKKDHVIQEVVLLIDY